MPPIQSIFIAAALLGAAAALADQQPGAAADAASAPRTASFQMRPAKRPAPPRASTAPAATTRAYADEFPPRVHERRDQMLSDFMHDFVVTRDERNRASASRMPKGSDARVWAAEKRARMAELSRVLAERQARAKAFEQLPMADIAKLFADFDAGVAAYDAAVERLMRAKYRTARQAADTVIAQLEAIEKARFLNTSLDFGEWHAIYRVNYVSQDQIVRSATLTVWLTPVYANAKPDAEPMGFCPTRVTLDAPDGPIQSLEVGDPSPPAPRIEWDGKSAFRVVNG